VFHPLSKHIDDFVKNTPLCVVFSVLFLVLGYPDETLSLLFNILLKQRTNQLITCKCIKRLLFFSRIITHLHSREFKWKSMHSENLFRESMVSANRTFIEWLLSFTLIGCVCLSACGLEYSSLKLTCNHILDVKHAFYKTNFFCFPEPLNNHLAKNHVEYLQFAFRWMNNLLMREMPLRCTIRLWDTYLVCTMIRYPCSSYWFPNISCSTSHVRYCMYWLKFQDVTGLEIGQS